MSAGEVRSNAELLERLKHDLLGLPELPPRSGRGGPQGRVEDETRLKARDRPIEGFTMISKCRLDNLQGCVERVLDDDIPGDLIETGVWRGGATIFMKKMLQLREDTHRQVWVADSFAGLPPPKPELYPADEGSKFHRYEVLAVPLGEVKANFERFGALDERVRFLEGFFADTLPTLDGCTWSVIRLDGDMYESTIVALKNLYPNLSTGGYLIVDDYGTVEECRRAVHDFREENAITDPVNAIDGAGTFWRKGSGEEALPGKPQSDLERALARRARNFEELYTLGLNRAHISNRRSEEKLQAVRRTAREAQRARERALKRLERARRALTPTRVLKRSLARRLLARLRDPTGAAPTALHQIEAAEEVLRDALPRRVS